jgi:regulator of protease activity HflC (stomatin/prohibitin superfamily)
MDLLDLLNGVVWAALALGLVYKFVRSIRLVPTKKAAVVERLGRYRTTLGPGFHALMPFLDKVAYVHDLREQSLPVPPQECFTQDNVKVNVDGVMYIAVVDPVKASYGVTNYIFAAIQLAQTTTRSVIGTLDLDKTFEERDLVSTKVVQVLSEAGVAWGITVYRYEIKGISTPETVRKAMEQQVTAERQRRALVAQSEGDRESRINRSEGHKMQLINRSEGEMQRRINEAEGRAREVRAIAEATAQSIEKIAEAVAQPGGSEALRIQLVETYLSQLQHIGRQNTRVILPMDLTRLNELLEGAGLDDPTRRP